MNISFTATMEDSLDDIGEGGKDWHKLIADFYKDFSVELEKSELTDVKCEKCGAPMRLKSGRFGNYYACSNYPNCENIRPVNEKVVIPTDIICEKCGGMMVEREGKYGKFLACGNYPKCRNSRPLDEKKSTVKCKSAANTWWNGRDSTANTCCVPPAKRRRASRKKWEPVRSAARPRRR